jgi:hypothetical protein
MAPKNRVSRGRSKKKARTKAKPAKLSRSRRTPKKPETRRVETLIPVQPLARIEPRARESDRITVENIRGETAIGDLLVAFPRTREVLVRNGMKLEAEDAGDIYMTLDAFSALNGLKTESLVQDLVSIAKEPSPQQAVNQLAAPPAA